LNQRLSTKRARSGQASGNNAYVFRKLGETCKIVKKRLPGKFQGYMDGARKNDNLKEEIYCFTKLNEILILHKTHIEPKSSIRI
jgi:hypothetical protein